MKKEKSAFLLDSYIESRRQIRKAMVENNLVLFVGAGTSLDAGMPSWNNAVSQIASKLNIQPGSEDTLKVPQYYYNERGKKDYTELMRRIFKYKIHLQEQEIHHKIISFQADTIVTTNYDHLIEQACRAENEIRHVVSIDKELPYKHGKELIKMHGDFEHDNFVLKEDDYLNFERNFRLIKNYIVSLAGTKTILFIGYSFSDPDVKQIFSLLKDILREDSQQAYMISVGEYNPIEADYFKNFGIRVIYAAQLPCNRDVVNKTTILENALDWILQNESESLLTEVYRKLGGYYYVQQPYEHDVREKLRGCGFSIQKISLQDYDEKEKSDNPEINVFESSDSDKPDGYVICGPYVGDDYLNLEKAGLKSENGANSAVVQYFQLCYMADSLVGNNYYGREAVQNTQWYQQIDKAQHFEQEAHDSDFRLKLTDAEIEQSKVLLSVFAQTGYKGFLVNVSPKEEIFIPFRKSKNSVDEEIVADAIDHFNFKKLMDIKEADGKFLTSLNPDVCLRQAHVEYFLGEDLKAYNLSKAAAAGYFKQPNYAKYFIAKCNQYYIGQSIGYTMKVGQSISSINRDAIKRETDRIDLDQIFSNIPDLTDEYGESGNEGKDFLKALYSFQLVYHILQDVVKNSKKVQEEADTPFILYIGTPAYIKLREDILAFYNYQERNHLLAYEYAEATNVYKWSAAALIKSALIKDKMQEENSINPNAPQIVNIHEQQIRPLEVLLAIRFLDADEIQKILGNCEHVPISENALKYVESVAFNLSVEPDKIRLQRHYFNSLLALCSHFDLSESLVKKVIKTLFHHMQNVNDVRVNGIHAYYFLQAVKDQKVSEGKLGIITLLCRFISNIMHILPKCNRDYELSIITAICGTIFSILQDCGSEYSNVNEVKESLLSSLQDQFKASFWASCYPYCSKQVKEPIQLWFQKWKRELSVKIEELRIYATFIINNIFENDRKVEDICLKNLEEWGESFVKSREKGSHSSKDTDVINCIYDFIYLAKDGKFLNTERLSRICSLISLDAGYWLLHMNDDKAFEKFEPKWVSLCPVNVLKEIEKNQSLKTNIAERLKAAYLENGLNDELVKIYFKYFA